MRADRPVLAGADLCVASGEIVALLGANGAGKSTLFRVMLGLEKMTRGEVLFDGAPIAAFSPRALATRVAYVPQAHVAPFPYLARDVVMMGRLPSTGLFSAPTAQDEAVVSEILARLKITSLATRPYTEISGGERQLVLIARALAQGAQILVMDEPMTGLDYGYQTKALRLFVELAKAGCGILFSTHHPEHALRIASRVAVLADGKIIADDAPRKVISLAMIERIYGVEVDADDMAASRIGAE
ncbi:MAG: ABC transporter ATP-binding protein [Methylocystis sp.]|uniref:ABC transporter ATP-binding protein n=1 Tax=Methylocystis sp. TaxID=1911079 RepID=UPI003D13733B